MGGSTFFARCVWKFPVLALAAGGMVFGSTQNTAFQDLAEHPLAVAQNALRWTASIPGEIQVSEFSPSFQFVNASPVSGGLLQAGDEPITTGSISSAPFDATIQRVNRATKGDLQTSRPPQVVIERKIPTSGTVWSLKDIFSSYEGEALPKIALAPAPKVPAETIMLAYNSFLTQDQIKNNSNTLLASVNPKQDPATETEPETTRPSVTYVAYAPATADANAPFGALFGGAAVQVAKPLPMPRSRPEEVDVAKFMTGHGPQRRRPGEHSWAANKLPPHVYKAAQQDCLARGIYFEARGEPVRGQAAVGQVIINRVKNPAYPSTICGVVYQNKKWRNRCQFSFACDGIRDRIRSTKHYKIAQRVAREVTDGVNWLPEVGDATHYHATYVRPRWARKLKKTDRIGRHIFYRTKYGGWS